ncbi:hypothetical protein K435DRAFT_833968 [Dendrothele bispora CBS 962.96]|uniref:Uncharacterized protein n=1 Tax=Dendrothele bispora (strain CBS 962.96) TaxID=1314807 RepID=A0A4S8MTT1_DENBC|nr:hypothetical protein K435DRAFT_833968 [Dendrothele bispora CBS 962.96]
MHTSRPVYVKTTTAPSAPSGTSSTHKISASSTSTTGTQQSEDELYTLSTYGDISHSEISFIPSISSGIDSPSRRERREQSYRKSTKRPTPPCWRKNSKKSPVTVFTLYERLAALKVGDEEQADVKDDGKESDHKDNQNQCYKEKTATPVSTGRPRTRSRAVSAQTVVDLETASPSPASRLHDIADISSDAPSSDKRHERAQRSLDTGSITEGYRRSARLSDRRRLLESILTETSRDH